MKKFLLLFIPFLTFSFLFTTNKTYAQGYPQGETWLLNETLNSDMIVTDLTGTKWLLEQDWTATSGFGQFFISGEIYDTNASLPYDINVIGFFHIGYTGVDADYVPETGSNGILILDTPTVLTPAHYYEFEITGGSGANGDDTTNTTLINWLETNATQIIELSIADKLQDLIDIKQDIKEAIENKDVDLTGVEFDGYAGKIDEIQTGGGGMTYEDYTRTLYLAWGKSNQFSTAWEHSLTVDTLEISENSDYLNQKGTAQYPNGETEGVIIPQGVTSIGDSAFSAWESNNQPLVIPDSVTSIGNLAFIYWASNNQPLVIPNSVTSIGNTAFSAWESNNQPLVIPDSVTSIGDEVFSGWKANNQPLVIPDSVTSIGDNAFDNWLANTHPLVIPDSVTSIEYNAFKNWELVPYIEIQAITPPTVHITAFTGQNDAPIYVPDESVDDYKTAEIWSYLADRIFPISDK